jgi:hypothetical protein
MFTRTDGFDILVETAQLREREGGNGEGKRETG